MHSRIMFYAFCFSYFFIIKKSFPFIVYLTKICHPWFNAAIPTIQVILWFRELIIFHFFVFENRLIFTWKQQRWRLHNSQEHKKYLQDMTIVSEIWDCLIANILRYKSYLFTKIMSKITVSYYDINLKLLWMSFTILHNTIFIYWLVWHTGNMKSYIYICIKKERKKERLRLHN